MIRHHNNKPTPQAEHIKASREKRLDGSPVADWSKSEFRAAVQDPPQWLILDAKKNGDLLVRLMRESGWDASEKWAAAKRWAKNHGANIDAPCRGINTHGGKRWASGNKSAEWRSHQSMKGQTPLMVAVTRDDPKMVECWLSGAWNSDTHGRAFEFALENQSDRVLEELWKLDPPVHRLKIGVEAALWSKKWTERLVDKGGVITQEITVERLKDWMGKQILEQNEIADVIARLDLVEKSTAQIKRVVRGQTKHVKINWEEVAIWCTHAGSKQSMPQNLVTQKGVSAAVVLANLLGHNQSNLVQAMDLLGPMIKKDQYQALVSGVDQPRRTTGLASRLGQMPVNEAINLVRSAVRAGFDASMLKDAIEDVLSGPKMGFSQNENGRRSDLKSILVACLSKEAISRELDLTKNEDVARVVRRKL